MRALPSSYGKYCAFSVCLTLAAVLGSTLLIQSAAAQEQPQLVVATPRPLITEVLDESRLTVLKGNTHPLARREFDLGTAPASLPMERMLLVLKRSDEQETALRKLLDDQQDKKSPHYHKWLTPEQFGAQFGPTDADMQTITSWLQSHGFQVGSTKGRTVLEFSGSASQVGGGAGLDGHSSMLAIGPASNFGSILASAKETASSNPMAAPILRSSRARSSPTAATRSS